MTQVTRSVEECGFVAICKTLASDDMHTEANEYIREWIVVIV